MTLKTAYATLKTRPIKKGQAHMKVLLTTGHCNPPLTRTFTCATMRYFEAKHKLTMYDAKGKVIAWAIIDEWQAVKYIDDNGQEHVIKGA